MPVGFNNYLSHFKDFAESYDPSILKRMKFCIATAEQHNLNNLIHVFDDFPIDYYLKVDGRRKHFHAATEVEKSHWENLYEDILNHGRFEKIEHDGDLNIVAGVSTEDKIKRLNTDILITACVDLLNKKGTLRKNVIEFLGLQELLERHKRFPDDIEKITHEILYSYYSQIVLVNLGLSALKKDCDVDQLEMLNGFSKSLFTVSEEA